MQLILKMERVLAYLHQMFNTDCMNIFLEQMLQYLGTREAVLVMDCASWHKSKNLKVPKNIEIIYLPPYSPACREALVIYKTEHFAQ